jgi:hypothetical protein
MSDDTYVWIGGAQGEIGTASNWLDTATGSVATVPPSSSTTLVFQPGTYSVTPVSNGGVGFSGENLILQGGAHLTLTSPAGGLPPGVFSFNQVMQAPGSSLTVSGAALWDSSTLLAPGATLDATHAAIDAHANGIFPIELGSLANSGTALLSGALGNVPQSGFNDGHTGPGFVQTGGFTQSESVLPSGNTLLINLGNITQGSSASPLQIGADNPDGSPGFSGLTISASSGNGFTPDLFPSIAAAMAAAFGPPTVGEYFSIGSIDVDTSLRGAHAELVSLDSGGRPIENLLITDHVV